MFFVAILKVLVAGGGIGDSTLFLAEQLNHTNAQVLWLFQSLQAHENIKILCSHNVLQINYSFCYICIRADCLSRLLADLSGDGPIQS